MNAATLALFVVVWPGHDIPPQTIELSECQRAVEAVQTAAQIRDSKFDVESDVHAYCIQLNTVADQTVTDLLERPAPPPASKQVILQVPLPPKENAP